MSIEQKIIVDLIPKGNKNRPGYSMKPEYITIHDTGNANSGADALAHAKYIKKPATSDSWHYTVDDKRIVQHLPLNENGWHSGDGKNGTGNRRSIGIEICMNQGIDRAKAEALAAELVAYLMDKFDIPLSKVVQHNHWSGKNCPKVIRAKSNGWKEFLKAVEGVNSRKVLNYPGYAHKYKKPIMKGEIVKLIQTVFKEKGYYKGKIDGSFGPLTDAAVRAFQKAMKLKVDGSVGPATWAALFN